MRDHHHRTNKYRRVDPRVKLLDIYGKRIASSSYQLVVALEGLWPKRKLLAKPWPVAHHKKHSRLDECCTLIGYGLVTCLVTCLSNTYGDGRNRTWTSENA